MNAKTKTPRHFYAVQYRSGRFTTTGQPNKRTKRYSIAITGAAFDTPAERDSWVDAGPVTSDMRGNCREAVTKAGLRRLLRGMSEAEFTEYAYWLTVDVDEFAITEYRDARPGEAE